MFWILKTPKFASNLFQSIVNTATNGNKESAKTKHKDGYGRLMPADEELKDLRDLNGNPVEPGSGSPEVDLASVTSSTDYNFMATTDDDDHDEEDEEEEDDEEEETEALTCGVCERAFANTWQLHCHQARKRHYGCSTCENIFPTLMALEAHKEDTNHWSDEDIFPDDDDDEEDDEVYETGFYDDEDDEEERENLL